MAQRSGARSTQLLRRGVSEKTVLLSLIHSAKDNDAKSHSVNLQPISDVGTEKVAIAKFPPVVFPIFTIPASEADDMLLKKQLILLSTTTGDIKYDDAFIIWVNFFMVMFPQSHMRFRKELEKCNFEIHNNTDLSLWMSEIEAFNDIDLDDVSKYEEAPAAGIMAVFGLQSCFMGRFLTPLNNAVWLARRGAAFAGAVGIDAKAGWYTDMMPDLGYSSAVYRSVSCKAMIRRASFNLIYGAQDSTISSVMSSSCRTALVYLAGSEMTPFIQINRYIVCQNPILLAWNELAKHADKLIAAYRKYESLNEMAPYAKLLYPPIEVPEFNRQNLDIFNQVAIAIAGHTGNVSMQNYKGSTTNPFIIDIVKQALVIVDMYGGARTHATEAVDQGVLIPIDNDNIRREIHRGGKIREDLYTDPDPNDPLLFTGSPQQAEN